VAKPPQVMEMGTRTGMCCLEKTWHAHVDQ
jgi:hypothetical protein